MARLSREPYGLAVKRSAGVALVVAPVLVAVNHYDSVLRMTVPEHFWLKAASTLVVPFFVSLYSSLRAAASQSGKGCEAGTECVGGGMERER